MSELDVSCDWLYKTKHRSKKKTRTPTTTPTPTPTDPSSTPSHRNGRRRSTSVSNAALSSDTAADPVMTPLTPVSSAGAPNSLRLTKVRTPSSPGSTVSATSATSTGPSPKANAKLARATSLSSSTTKAGFMGKTQGAPAPVKRSLFGSLFGKKGGKSGKTPAAALASIDTAIEGDSGETAESVASPMAPPSPSPTPTIPTPTESAAGSDPLSALRGVSLRRVAFSVAAVAQEPPQQLPSRTPRRGNVVVPADLLAGTAAIAQGIAQGAASPAGATASVESVSAPLTESSPEYRAAVDAQRAQQAEAAMHTREAHAAAKRIAHEVASYGSGPLSASGRAGTTPLRAESPAPAPPLPVVSIDTPIHAHQHHFGEEETSDTTEATPEMVYTRCCHLREILPIPSTLRQLQGRAAPLQSLRFLNARPTLIDVLSFCDFVSVGQVTSLEFDNVALTPAMLRAVLCAARTCGALERLSLRNVPVGPAEWPLLCRLVLDTGITRLDLSQTTVRQPQGEPPLPLRHTLDFGLLAAVLAARPARPLEELLLNGVKFSRDARALAQFSALLPALTRSRDNTPTATAPGPLRLGLASSELSQQQAREVLQWMSTSGTAVEGVDLGYNDLGPSAKTVCNRLATLPYPGLHYFTLNSTGLARAYDAALLIKYLARLPALHFLDLSGLPHLFPDILPYLHKYLPRFPQLRRLHCDNNDLPYKELTVLASILAKCPHLTHVSLLQNTPDKDDTHHSFPRNNCWATLYHLARAGRTLVNLDIHYDAVPPAIQSRIALALVSNMNRAVAGENQGSASAAPDELAAQDDLLFDGALLSETAEQVLHKLNALAQPQDAPAQSIDQTKKYLLKKYFEKMRSVQAEVQREIAAMFARRQAASLRLQEKENLVRLLLLERNLANVLALCAHIPQFNTLMGKAARDSVEESVVPAVPQRPHLMATDSGRTVDVLTGKPVLCRASSSTLVHGREQEQEEGELHRWGVFVQQQNDMYPEPEAPALPPLITKIPSGTNLRTAIMRAKGIDSITDLISNVNSHEVDLESIYGGDSTATDTGDNAESGGVSPDDEVPEVDETYERLLNGISQGRAAQAT
ncbi:hypothetical protein DAKH74_035080 [Maudiozyma humilis]|uniref:RNI-like protein n=1 Tax=Maudiozyma humilis TaxID=51915 RepID=A0AAV5S0P3_MAUHU|nr:hypothetical protein DAKH74_035080 [Kazachstania humilis]